MRWIMLEVQATWSTCYINEPAEIFWANQEKKNGWERASTVCSPVISVWSQGVSLRHAEVSGLVSGFSLIHPRQALNRRCPSSRY
jgi:hypothetical protein